MTDVIVELIKLIKEVLKSRNEPLVVPHLAKAIEALRKSRERRL